MLNGSRVAMTSARAHYNLDEAAEVCKLSFEGIGFFVALTAVLFSGKNDPGVRCVWRATLPVEVLVSMRPEIATMSDVGL